MREPADLPPTDFRLTEAVGNVGEHSMAMEQLALRRERDPTEDDVIGPYYRKRAPFRAKISPPLAKGDILLISGRVWGLRSRRPINHCSLEVWQANADGHYDNEDPAHPPQHGSFVNRARLQSDEHGFYEFETIFPGPYQMDARTWRTPHIHLMVRAFGFKTLVTQLFFAGAPYLDSDPFVKRSLIIHLVENSSARGSYRKGAFDIVLADDIDEMKM